VDVEEDSSIIRERPRDDQASDGGQAGTILRRPTLASSKVSFLEILDAVSGVYNIRKPLILHPVDQSNLVREARSCVMVVAKQYGFSSAIIGKEMDIASTKVGNVVNRWNARQVETRIERISNIRRILSEKTIAAERARQRMNYSGGINVASQDEQIRRLRKDKGFTVRGIAKHLGIDPVVVCDVLGLDRAWAKC